MNPAPPVTRISTGRDAPLTILARPVVRQCVVRSQPILVWLRVVVRFGRHIYHDRRLGGDAFPPVIHEAWDQHQHRVLCADDELVDAAVGPRIWPRLDEPE